MSQLTKRFPSSSVPLPDTVNHAGGVAYTADPQEVLAELLLLGTFGNTYYASGDQWATRTADLCKRMAKEDPHFLAQAAVVARTEGYIRSAPLVALAALLGVSNEAKTYGRRIFSTIIRTGDDLRNFVGLMESKQFRQGFGGISRRLVAEWLNTQLTAYQAVKYAGSGDQFSLRNILRLAHPAPSTATQDAIFQWLVKGTTNEATPSLIHALADLQAGSLDPVTAITREGLPFEAVTGRLSSMPKAVWVALLTHAPYMFLLRSLEAMGKAGVWEDPENVDRAMEILGDPARIHKAMLFPFRYYTALLTITPEHVPSQLVDMLYTALETAVGNLPDLGQGHVAIAPDISGSMQGTYVDKRQNTNAAAIAGIFTGALWHQHPTARILPFDTVIHPVTTHHRDSVMTIARTLANMDGGGTDLSVPIRWLAEHREVVDLFIGLTDSEDWSASGGWYGHGNFAVSWKAYKQIAPHAQAVLIQLVPNGTRPTPSSDSSVHYVYGWSDAVLRYIAHVAQGSSMIQHIRETVV